MQQLRINILGVAQMQDIGIELGNSTCKLCISHFMTTELTETKQNFTSKKRGEKKPLWILTYIQTEIFLWFLTVTFLEGRNAYPLH
jgi:hypothetical protein